MTEPTRRTRGVQRGPRSVQVVEGVRAATLAELSRVGFAGLTVDSVARAAGVSRTTIYRRWPSKTALLAAVVEPLLERSDADPATGTLAGDLLALLLATRDNAASPQGRAMLEAAMSGSAELRELIDVVAERAKAPFRRAVAHAVARGELHDAEDAEMVAHLAFSGIAMWEQTHGAPADDETCRRLLRVLLGGFGTA